MEVLVERILLEDQTQATRLYPQTVATRATLRCYRASFQAFISPVEALISLSEVSEEAIWVVATGTELSGRIFHSNLAAHLGQSTYPVAVILARNICLATQ